MKYRLIQISILLAVSFAFASPVAAKCSDADKAALKKLDLAWGEAVQARDRAALEKIYSDDFAGFDLVSMTGKKDAIDGALGTPPGDDGPETTYDHYMISCTAKSAVVTHRVVVHGPEGVFFARSVHVLERNGDSWQVVANTGSPMDAAGTIIYQEISGYQAYMNRDEEWFDMNTDENYMGVGLDGIVRSKSAMMESMAADKTQYDSVELSDVNVNVDGDLAVISGKYHVTGKAADGSPVDVSFQFTRTLANKFGSWVAVASHSSQTQDDSHQ